VKQLQEMIVVMTKHTVKRGWRSWIAAGTLLAILITSSLLPYGCSQAPNGPTLTNAAPSAEAVINRALTAIRQNDAAALHRQLITRYEHDSVLAPLMRDSAWVANFDLELAWNLLSGTRKKGVLRALEDYAGDSLTIMYIRYREPDEHYGPLTLHKRPAVQLRDETTGEEFESWMFGTIMELNGQFKLISIRD
jgi:hypothetical protein